MTANIEVSISEDNTKAYIHVEENEAGELTREVVEQLLEAEGVVYGINEDAITSIEEKIVPLPVSHENSDCP